MKRFKKWTFKENSYNATNYSKIQKMSDIVK